MRKGCYAAVLLCIFPLLVLPAPASAQWVENGKAVCSAVENQVDPLVIPDGMGGSIIAWVDMRSVTIYEIYAQRVDEYGRDLWATDGQSVYTGSGFMGDIDMISDGASGAFITVRTGEWLYVQHLYADGTTWSSSTGTQVCNSISIYNNGDTFSSMTLDDGGGVLIAWVDGRSLFTLGELYIYAQRVDASGIVKWATNGVPVCTAETLRGNARCSSDLEGGAIITWTDERSDAGDIYAQRIDSIGTVLWTTDGVPVCIETGMQKRQYSISDGVGGTIIAWEDLRGDPEGIYVQRLDSNGVAKWVMNGVAATTAPYSQEVPRLVSDGKGGVILTWYDIRKGSLEYMDIYAQRLDSAGTVLWEPDGTAICSDYYMQQNPRITEDGAGGAVIVWEDGRNTPPYYDIYTQRINSDGVVLWEENGDAVCVGIPNGSHDPSIAYIGRRGVVIAWCDGRNGETDYNIYGQGLDLQGNWGYPSPLIHSVEDIPGDQGGYINLFWYASIWEDPLYDQITHYTLWRAVEPQQALMALDRGAALIEDPGDLDLEGEDRVFRLLETGTTTYFWELVGTQQAYRFEAYALTIPTLFDSTEVYHDYHYFQVLAHVTDQDYYVSSIDSAYSVDDLCPDVPEGLVGEQSFMPEGLQLTWDPNGEEDLAGYRVYRGMSADFVPSLQNRIGTPVQPNLFDDAWTWDAGYWYNVVAVDVHGNESEYAVLGPDMVTGEDATVPDATFLAQNFPNPFNPATTVCFGVKKRGHVSLRIYDTAGRLVVTLIDQEKPAGRYEVVWSGSDGADNTVASGIYFYQLTTGDFVQTKKMVLLR
jgi:hypothetical protein